MPLQRNYFRVASPSWFGRLGALVKAPTRVLAPAEAKRTKNQGIMYTSGVGCTFMKAQVSRVPGSMPQAAITPADSICCRDGKTLRQPGIPNSRSLLAIRI
jgi:hypothetical protein